MKKIILLMFFVLLLGCSKDSDNKSSSGSITDPTPTTATVEMTTGPTLNTSQYGDVYYTGTVKNNGDDPVYFVKVTLTIYSDAERTQILDSSYDYPEVPNSTLAGNTSVNYEIQFYGIQDASQIKAGAYELTWDTSCSICS